MSLACPLECEYLQEAHRHEKPLPANPAELPNGDVEVDEEFVYSHQELLIFCAFALVEAAKRTAGAVDEDVLEVLAAEIRTQRTAQSGLVYESRPENFVAQGVQRLFSASLADYERERLRENSLDALRTSDLLRILVFLHRLATSSRNGRPRGRMFLDSMNQLAKPAMAPQPSSGIIIGEGY